MLNNEDELTTRRQNYQRASKKTFIMRKVDLAQDSSLQAKISEAFSDPEKYLQTDKDMMIGRVTQYPKIDKSKNLVKKYSTFGLNSLNSFNTYNNNYKLTRSNSLIDRSIIKVTKSNISSTKSDGRRKGERKNSSVIGDNGIQEIYNKFKIIQKNHNVTHIEICDDDIKIQKEMKKILESQSKMLLAREDSNKNSEKLARYIAFKTKKKEDEVLMNKTGGFRIKEELKNTMEIRKPIEERYGNFNWMISLRRPDHFEGTRYAYVNYGNSLKENDNWIKIKEKFPENNFMETVRSPDSTGYDQLKNLKSFKMFNRTIFEKYKIDLDEMQNTNGIMV